MWFRRARILPLGLAVVLAGLSACGEAPSRPMEAKDFSVCMITDTGGIDDRSFNAAVWQGLQDAADRNADIDASFRTSESQKDYEPNLRQSVKKGCDVIIAVGALMAPATGKVAQSNPKRNFIIVDAKVNLPNVFSVQFDTAQPAFLAGYLAAGMTKTDKIATFGAQQIDPVTIFMDGFAEGADHYNKTKHKKVKLLGWNADKQKGTFVGSFTDQSGAQETTMNFFSQDADIVMPVAGNASLGAAAAAKNSDGKSLIWVDFDGCESAEQYCGLFLTSVVKEIPTVISDSLVEAGGGKQRSGSYIGTLHNHGVTLAPYHDFDSQVPEELKDEIERLRADIVDGKVTVKSQASP